MRVERVRLTEENEEEDRRGNKGPEGQFGPHHQHAIPLRHAPCELREVGVTGEEFDIVPTMEANGNEPISPLSVAAEPRCAL